MKRDSMGNPVLDFPSMRKRSRRMNFLDGKKALIEKYGKHAGYVRANVQEFIKIAGHYKWIDKTSLDWLGITGYSNDIEVFDKIFAMSQNFKEWMSGHEEADYVAKAERVHQYAPKIKQDIKNMSDELVSRFDREYAIDGDPERRQIILEALAQEFEETDGQLPEEYFKDAKIYTPEQAAKEQEALAAQKEEATRDLDAFVKYMKATGSSNKDARALLEENAKDMGFDLELAEFDMDKELPIEEEGDVDTGQRVIDFDKDADLDENQQALDSTKFIDNGTGEGVNDTGDTGDGGDPNVSEE